MEPRRLLLVVLGAAAGACGSTGATGNDAAAGGSGAGGVTGGSGGGGVTGGSGAGGLTSGGSGGGGAGGIGGTSGGGGVSGASGSGIGGVGGASGSTGGAAGGISGVGGSAATGGAGGTSGTGGRSCGVQTYTAAGRPADVLVLLDRSASMRDDLQGNTPQPGALTKWSQVIPALTEVINATNASISWGLKTFPEAGAECVSSTVTTQIDVPVAPANAAAVNAAIAATTPDGNGTPTGPAIAVGRGALEAIAGGNQKFLLLVTDGIPTCADGVDAGWIYGSNIARTSAINTVTAAAAAGIHTFVIGLVSDMQTTTTTLNMMAVAGGEPRAGANPLTTRFYQALTKDELIAALRTLTGSVVSCSFPLGSPPPNPGNVSVSVGGTEIPRDTTGVNGWNYADAANLEVRVHGSWCNTIMTSGRAAVQIAYGCTPGGGGTGGAGGPTDAGAAAGGSGALLLADDFADGDADGWITDGPGFLGAWTVVSDGGNRVYQQSSVDASPTVSVGGAFGWTNQRAEVKVKFPTLPAAGGRVLLAARVRDLGNYYYVRLDPTGPVLIGKRMDGASASLVTNRNLTPFSAGTWYTLGLEVNGTTLTAYVDGVAVATTTDTDFANGGIALGAEHASAMFDDVRVTTP